MEDNGIDRESLERLGQALIAIGNAAALASIDLQEFIASLPPEDPSDPLEAWPPYDH